MRSTTTDRSLQQQLDNGWVLAAHWKRIIAFLLDVVLVTLIALVITFQFWLPNNYPESWSTFMDKVETLQSSEESLQGMELTAQEQDMFIYGEMVILLVFWFYFFGSELLFKGSSLGKKVFQLRVVSWQRQETLNFWESMIRAFAKTVTLLVLFPFLQVSYLLAFFTRKRQAGHDYICRSCVIEDFSLENIDTSGEGSSSR